MSSQLKFKVISQLLNGDKPKEIEASVEGSSYATILRWKRELEEAQAAGTVADLIDLDKAMFGEVLAGVAAKVPEVLAADVVDSLGVITKAKSVAEVLQLDFQTTAKVLNTRIKSLALSVENTGELDMLADSLCKLQNAFFNKNATQVNVQNNYETGPAYSSFLGDKPGE